jgi:hypothetical protein
MTEHIERLEKELIALKDAYEKQQRDEYEKQNHKTFKKGDWIKKGEQIGKVGWIKNDCMNITEDMGYCGIDLRSGNGGFAAACKRDEWQLIEGEELTYLTKKHKLKIELTGEQVQDLLMRYKYVNTSDTHNKFMKALKEVGK